jgi:hypothetical protein
MSYEYLGVHSAGRYWSLRKFRVVQCSIRGSSPTVHHCRGAISEGNELNPLIEPGTEPASMGLCK